MDHHEQVPTWGLINFQFLYQVHLAQSGGKAHSTTINQLVDATSKHIGCTVPLAGFWSPVNAETVFSFLYSVIVVPKELFSGCSDAFFDNFSVDYTDIFKGVDSGIGKLESTFDIVRFLRNSISHVNYRVDTKDSSSVSMWNNNRQGHRDIEVFTDIDLLANFGVRFAKHYAAYQTANNQP